MPKADPLIIRGFCLIYGVPRLPPRRLVVFLEVCQWCGKDWRRSGCFQCRKGLARSKSAATLELERSGFFPRAWMCRTLMNWENTTVMLRSVDVRSVPPSFEYAFDQALLDQNAPGGVF